MKELINLRKKREKHFLNKDGTITVHVFDKDVHFLNNGVYEEIDNTLIDKGDYYENKSNSFHALFSKKDNDLVNVKKDNHYLRMYFNSDDLLKLDKKDENINYKNLKNNIDFNYKMISSRLKESIILNCRETVPETLEFFLNTNLILELQENKTIIAKSNDEIIFTIDAPFMIDARGSINRNINYELIKLTNGYLLKLKLDMIWIKEPNTVFPVTVDPTIINGTGENVYDTYITSKNSTTSKNSSEKLILGVTSDDVNRILLKFTLPEIGTGFDIIDARGYITSLESDLQTDPYIHDTVYTNVHEITSEWDESTATWSNMHDKYNPIIEDSFVPFRTNLILSKLSVNDFNITNLVKRWYAGKPNYGVMLKWNNELYDEEIRTFKFYSKTYDLNNSAANRAYLTITYRNQNGLEDYMTYTTQNFSDGQTFINNLTGNLTASFNLNKTIGGKYPVNLNMIYNTNDVVLNNNIGYGLGLRLNLHETIKEVVIDDENYLEYTDGDGTIHYFFYYENKYEDEDGLGLTALLLNNNYVVENKNGYKYIFVKNNDAWYLTSMIDSENNQVTINYDTLKRIVKVIDANNSEINLTYENNKMTIASSYSTTIINYDNNKLVSLVSKMGTTNFYYNSKNIIEKIIDINGLGYKYEYYEMIPYKIKKLEQLGLNNAIGRVLNFEYGFCVTRIMDKKGQYHTYSFNKRGCTIGVTNLNGEENLNEGYGTTMYYDTENFPAADIINRAVNKMYRNTQSIKFTKNLISNGSFESECANRTSEFARTGTYSYKINGSTMLEYNISANKYYTFSGYFKNSENITLKPYVGNDYSKAYIENIEIPNNIEFTRFDYTFFANDNITYFGIDIIVNNNNNIAYLDDIQLEEGKTANYYNLLENADFSDGFNNWNLSSEDYTGDIRDKNVIVELDNGIKYVKLVGGPETSTILSQFVNISGKEGDIFYLSFWYKNTGIKNGWVESYAHALINFCYPDDFMGYGEPWMDELNYHSSEWQFYSGLFVAEDDYDGLYVDILFTENANNLCITNFVLSKDIEEDGLGYDVDTGNLTSFRQMGGPESTFTYDKSNQLTSMFDPIGNAFKFEYDNDRKTRILKGISATGISNEIKYDSYGNPVKTIINNVNPNNEIIIGKKYNIRLKGTDKYLNINYNTSTILLKEDNCVSDYFEITKEGEYYRFSIQNKSLSVINMEVVLTNDLTTNSLFKLKLNDNGSYSIISKNNETNCLYVLNDILKVKEITEDESEQFYFEDVGTNLFIENKAEYTEDGKFVTKTIDSLGNIKKYEINPINGLTQKIIHSNGNVIAYEYNDKEQITKIKQNDKETIYEYNSANLVNKIITDNVTYNIAYDNFLNVKNIIVGTYNLITNNYDESNGNLLSKLYGNNCEIIYNYDELNRIVSISKGNDIYNYTYDNFGNISSILNDYNRYKYYYDLSKRISKYIYEDNQNNKYMIEYDYDVNNNIINHKYHLNDTKHTLNYEYNKENINSKVIIDNNLINYNYDILGRIINSNINNNFNINYEYVSFGNKTSQILKSIQINTDLYEFEYNESYNITDIYLNNKLINHYEYGLNNELLKEFDYSLNKSHKYVYDNNGNILNSYTFDLVKNVLLNKDVYEYSDNNWKDKLTKFNDKVITYDNIGNPLTIGNINLIWQNGQELNEYKDEENNLLINYKYNLNGLRTSKVVNNVTTEYYLEGNNIIFEKTNNNTIFYIRDSEDKLLGLKYNTDLYYYIKNAQEDIIGIMDSNYNILAKYYYDSWGNILSIRDNNDIEITDKSHIAHINPFRYRSYYYDAETKLYYLNKRYYNPEIKRFLNADTYICEDSYGKNLFVYAGNNPINYKDIDGKLWGRVLAGALAGIAINLVIKMAINKSTKKKWHEGIIGAVVNGAISGAISGAGASLLGSVIGNFMESSINEASKYSLSDKKEEKRPIDIKQLIKI